jgi:signal transduction histidine kinase
MKFFRSTKFKISFIYAATVLLVCLFYWGLFFLFLQFSLRALPQPYEIVPTQEDEMLMEDDEFFDEEFNQESLSVDDYDEITDNAQEVSDEDLPNTDEDYEGQEPLGVQELLSNYEKIFYLISDRLPLISFFFAILVSFMSFGVGYLFSSYLLSPINRLQDSIETIDLDSITQRDVLLNQESDDEFGRLVASYNTMLKRVQESYERQKQFVQNASHELKTPLSIILTNTELIESSLKDLDNEDKESLEAIKRSIERMNILIKDMLLLEQSSYGSKREKIDLVLLLRDVVSDFRSIIEKKTVSLKFNEDEGEFFFNGSRNLLERLFANLISNAIKYGGRDNAIDITFEKLNDGDYEFVVRIKDFGRGMNKEEVDHLWDRFYRGEKSRSRSSGGSGLGLSIVKQIADFHDIKINVDSRKAQGTQFSLYFPK